jgi:WD40 repeat protein
MSEAELEFYGRVPWKVHALDLHPSRPWLCTVDERGGVAIWDLRVNIVLSRWHLNVMLDDDHIVGAKVGKLGQVLAGKFVDMETAVAAGASVDDRVAPVGRWIFVAFANHAVLLEWRAGQIIHFRTTTISEGRPSTAATFAPAVGVMAFGGADGITRIVDWRRGGSVRARLQGPHTKAVSALAATAHVLLSGGADGSVAAWDLRRDAQMTAAPRPHSDRVTALAAGPRTALSLSADRAAVLWASDSGRERVRARLQIGKAWAAAPLADGSFAVRRRWLCGAVRRRLMLRVNRLARRRAGCIGWAHRARRDRCSSMLL